MSHDVIMMKTVSVPLSATPIRSSSYECQPLHFLFLRSRAKSASIREPITMDNNMVTMQPNAYDNSSGFEEDYTNSGFYMEIPDDGLQGGPGQLSHTNSVAKGKRQSGTYQEISDLHIGYPRVGPYEEIPDIVTDLPSRENSMTYEPIDDVVSYALKPPEKVNKKDNPSQLPAVVEEPPKHVNSLLGNNHRPISIMKSADETVVTDNELYEPSDVTEFVENDIYEG